MRPRLAVIAVLLLGPLAGGADAAYPPAQNGKLAFASQRHGGDLDVFTVNPDGSGLRNLTKGNASDDTAPAFSPGGDRIAFQRRAGGDNDIFVMQANGAKPVNLTPGSAADDTNPAYSPDGTRIVFARDVNPGIGTNFELISIKTDGTSAKNLTKSPGNEDDPDFSPDGRRIVYSFFRGATLDVRSISSSGGGVRTLTPGADFETTPAYSPNGEFIYFSRALASGGRRDIYVMGDQGVSEFGAINVTAQDCCDEWQPAPAPDHTRLAFNAFNPGFNELFVTDLNGANSVNVSRDVAGTDDSPSWQYVRRQPAGAGDGGPAPTPPPSYSCAGRTATIVGSDSRDVIMGTKRADVIVARGGNDKVKGRGGKDRICGGEGKDELSGGVGKDKLFGEAGKDKLFGNKGNDKLVGGGGKDLLVGGKGRDKLKGSRKDRKKP